ncbi:glycoside hydrolase family 43 protein [Bowmanella yangjiangensis]|uniref:Glycoside hydrolase family 43 protein n=1 Tax=Bowmanella yangjiangensis TaxID=2811230 RepID=A0ABS3CN96_9ALTE|nr:glycoside hydrolase family 43 protein [Bowmanella yangjiangensis]MBN7818584.1 glycoside hydrolase family 43 protein [Bowmanella yangjiangensis]
MRIRIVLTFILLATGLLGCTEQRATVAVPQTAQASFSWFEYQGSDPVFAEPLAPDQYQNPVVAGFFPDPSITRRGDDYYMAVSSFTYTPGVPILHSRDLVNWQLIGHALTRESQLDVSGARGSRGIFAPTLRYHDGVFYMITTLIDNGGNFFVTATDPAGPWSDPVWLPELDGIDPDIFFDDDGRVYIAHNGPPPGEPLYEGHRAIWLWEFDPKLQKVKASSGRIIVNGGVDLSKQPIWIEAPHLYKINDWYYLLCAEGGTADEHSEVVFRTRSLDQAFEPYEGNPILTQRDLDPSRPDPITTAGHADIVQTPDGEWWAIFLATRAYDQRFYNTGREAFLLPVSWQDDWPTILPAGETVTYRPVRPAGLDNHPVLEPLTGNFTWRDEFNQPALNFHWSLLRDFARQWLKIANDKLQVQPQAGRLSSLEPVSFIGRRQQHMHYRASTALTLSASGLSAGITALQSEAYHYYLGVRRSSNGTTIFLEQADGEGVDIIASEQLSVSGDTEIGLAIEGDKDKVRFFYQLDGETWLPLGGSFDGKLLSTQVAGGFVGTMLGLHSRLEKQDI